MTAQLINAEDGYHLWSERYDRELTDVFAIQDDIAQAIAEALRVTLALALCLYAPNLAAYEAFLQGRHYWAKLTPESLALSRNTSSWRWPSIRSLRRPAALWPSISLRSRPMA